MQPVTMYRPQGYPPRGPQWPQFGDAPLGETLSVSQEAHQSLSRKRLERQSHHEDMLMHHNLQPTVPHFAMDQGDVEEAQQGTQTDAYQEGQGTQTDAYQVGQGTQTERRPLVASYGLAGSYEAPKKNLVRETGGAGGYVPQPLEPQDGVMELHIPKRPGSSDDPREEKRPKAAPKKKLAYQRGVSAVMDPEDDETQTIQYDDASLNPGTTVDYGDPLEIDDEEMLQHMSRKRPGRDEDEEKKKPRIKTEIKDEKKIKLEGQRVASVPLPLEDDEVELSGVNINRSTDMAFWEQQSAREIRSQFNLRFPSQRGDWAFKSRVQLLALVRRMIADGTWR